MDKILLQKYADFIVKVGVNVNPGQYFLINCPVECAEFGRACAKAGFAAGAKDVIVRFHDEKLTRIRYENAAEETLAQTMKIPATRLNIKATTEEGLGFTGSGAGIACHAVCLLEPLEDRKEQQHEK